MQCTLLINPFLFLLILNTPHSHLSTQHVFQIPQGAPRPLLPNWICQQRHQVLPCFLFFIPHLPSPELISDNTPHAREPSTIRHSACSTTKSARVHLGMETEPAWSSHRSKRAASAPNAAASGSGTLHIYLGVGFRASFALLGNHSFKKSPSTR